MTTGQTEIVAQRRRGERPGQRPCSRQAAGGAAWSSAIEDGSVLGPKLGVRDGHLLGVTGVLSQGVAMLLCATAGALLMALIGATRILQVRRRAQRRKLQSSLQTLPRRHHASI